jgi:hypothetical protein
VITDKWNQVDKAFAFFSEKYAKKASFNLDELAENTGWSLSTVKTYLRKKWSKLLVKDDDGFSVTELISKYSDITFRQHQSQNVEIEKYFYQTLVDKAISACISAIEIYNKPNFEYREETFSILMVNAWELLLKAKLVKDNEDNRASIYFLMKGKIVITPSGNAKTIGAVQAMNRLIDTKQIPKPVELNIKLLLNIRDDSVHFIHDDVELSTQIQEIGTASLQNFMSLAMNWFSYDFTQFNFYLMPVSFFHLSDVTSFSIDNEVKSNLLSYLRKIEKEEENCNDPNFAISLKLMTKLVKATAEEALQVRVTNDPKAPEIIFSEEETLKNYPNDYYEVIAIFKKRYKDFKQNNKFHDQMRTLKAEGEKYCKVRRLDPDNPNSINKTFYHNRVIDKFDEWYERV